MWHLNRFGMFSNSTLKIVEIITMFIDHIGASLLYRLIKNGYFAAESLDFWKECYLWCRVIGRTAFPIFAFLLVEGYLHTQNVKKYLARLMTLAVISEVIYDLALSASYPPDWIRTQNIFFTLALGLLTMILVQKAMTMTTKYFWLRWISVALVCGLACLVAGVLRFDYGFKGILVILIFYILYCERGMASLAAYLVMVYTNANSLPGFLMVNLYNGKRGLRSKYFFYLFYPLHLLVLYGISVVLLK